MTNRLFGPLIRMTATPQGRAPLDKAQMVSSRWAINITAPNPNTFAGVRHHDHAGHLHVEPRLFVKPRASIGPTAKSSLSDPMVTRSFPKGRKLIAIDETGRGGRRTRGLVSGTWEFAGHSSA
ncbi:MAG: hypothetical protein JNM13_14370 [Hyphomicrobiaceae bacterium]|nr:hypothetical protein [Hyphomicrobiaceae bacterium]